MKQMRGLQQRIRRGHRVEFGGAKNLSICNAKCDTVQKKNIFVWYALLKPFSSHYVCGDCIFLSQKGLTATWSRKLERLKKPGIFELANRMFFKLNSHLKTSTWVSILTQIGTECDANWQKNRTLF